MLSSFKEILWNAQVTKLPQILWTTQEKKKRKKKKSTYTSVLKRRLWA